MQNTDWKNLPFGYMKTDYNIRCLYKDGKWQENEVSTSEYINLHIASTCLHYGQEAFEGMKAFRGKDGKIRLFRWRDNAKRMRDTASGIKLAVVPEKVFKEAIFQAIKLNEKFVPPYGYGASLYVRPLLLGTGAEVGVKPSKEYTFIVFVTPVGPYFKDGFYPVDVMICRDHDRAAPLGTGALKVGGNYAASLSSLEIAHNLGFATSLYLDAKEKKYIDEAGPANFFGIKKNMYITPDSKSILPSITNMSLMHMARNMNMKVECRPVDVAELDTFDEVGACGTAAVITPIKKIVDLERKKTFEYCKDGKPGPVISKLYYELTAIQSGDAEDKYGWIDYIK